MNSKPTYFEDTYRFEDPATIESVKKDDKGNYIVLDQTIFYPQGGGQPSDQGHVLLTDTDTDTDAHTPIHIRFVKMFEGEIRHYIEQGNTPLMGQKIRCVIDADRRLLHAKLHTFGHLLSNIVEGSYPQCKAIKGHHFPGECYVEFRAKTNCEMIDLDLLNQQIAESITKNLRTQSKLISSEQLLEICPPEDHYAIPMNQPLRVVCIGDYKFQLCGGTHVHGTCELVGLKLTKLKIKGGSLKINYSF